MYAKIHLRFLFVVGSDMHSFVPLATAIISHPHTHTLFIQCFVLPREQALAAFSVIKPEPAAKAPSQVVSTNNAPATKQAAVSITTQRRQMVPTPPTARVRNSTPPKPKPTSIVLKPASTRRTGISITRVVGGDRNVANSAKPKALAKGDLKNRIRVQSGKLQCEVCQKTKHPQPTYLLDRFQMLSHALAICINIAQECACV